MRAQAVSLAMLGIIVACADPVQPAAATALRPSVSAPAPTPSPARPPWPGCPGDLQIVYQEAAPIYQAYYASQSGSLISQYTLCANGTFDLAFASGSFGLFDYQGTYSRSDSTVALYFNDSDLAGAWIATAKLRGDLMSVEYDEVMAMADFVNGPYVRQSTP